MKVYHRWVERQSLKPSNKMLNVWFRLELKYHRLRAILNYVYVRLLLKPCCVFHLQADGGVQAKLLRLSTSLHRWAERSMSFWAATVTAKYNQTHSIRCIIKLLKLCLFLSLCFSLTQRIQKKYTLLLLSKCFWADFVQ